MRPVSRGVAVGMPYIWSSVAASTVACAVLEPRPLNIGSRLKTGLLTAFLSVGRRRPAEPPSCWGPLYGSGRSLRGALSGQVGPARGGARGPPALTTPRTSSQFPGLSYSFSRARHEPVPPAGLEPALGRV